MAEAEQHWSEAVRLAEDIDDVGSAARGRLCLAACRVEQGDRDAVERFHAAAAEVLGDPEAVTGMIFHHPVLAFGAGVDAALGRLERVALGPGASETLTERGLTLRWDLVDYFQQKVEEARRTLDDEAFEEARYRGATLDDEAVTAFLLER